MELTKITAKMPYEAVVLMHPDANLDEQKELFKKNKATIETFKGSVTRLKLGENVLLQLQLVS